MSWDQNGAVKSTLCTSTIKQVTIMAEAFLSNMYETWNECWILFLHMELVQEHKTIDENLLQQWTEILANTGWYTQKQKN